MNETMDPTVKESQVRSVDVSIGPGRGVLRISKTADCLVIASGFSEGDPGFHRPAWYDGPIRLPASVIPQLIEALQALQEAS